MVDPIGFLTRKAIKAGAKAIGAQYQKSRRERTNSVDLDVVGFELATSLRGHTKSSGRYQSASVNSVDHHPSLGIFATAGADGTVRIWSTSRPNGRIIFSTSGLPVRSVAFAADGRLAIGGSDGRLTVTEPVSAKDVRPEVVRSWTSKHALERVAWGPRDSLLASYSSSGDVMTCDPASGPLGVLFHTRLGEFVNSPCLRFTPEGSKIVRTTFQSVAALTTEGVAAESVRVTNNRGSKKRTCGFDYSPDGRQIAIGINDGTIGLYRWPGGELVRVLRSHEPVAVFGALVPAVAYSPDGQLIATAGYDGVLKIWRASDGALLGDKNGQGGVVYALKWVSGSDQVAVASLDGVVRIWTLSRPGNA
jgi:WD40 repeat protein